MKRWIFSYLKDFIHNVFIHPLMMFLPANLATKMHDINANWAYGLDRYDEIKLEKSIAAKVRQGEQSGSWLKDSNVNGGKRQGGE